jgi:hypothetical protein
MAQSGSNTRKRSRSVAVRFTDAELVELDRRAAEAGLARGDYMRAVLLETAPLRRARLPKVDRDALARVAGELGQIGNHTNQIARELNRGRETTHEEVQEARRALLEARDAIFAALGIRHGQGAE